MAADTKEPLIPKVTANTTHKDLVPSIPNPSPGKYLMDAIGPDGKEMGKFFEVSPRTYERSFSDTKKFVIKKKPQL